MERSWEGKSLDGSNEERVRRCLGGPLPSCAISGPALYLDLPGLGRGERLLVIRKKGRWIEIELSRGGEKRRNAGCGESGTDQSPGDTGEVGGSGLVTWQQGASPDWRSPESGARALGAGGRAGRGGGRAAVSSGTGRPRGGRACLLRPLQPRSGSSSRAGASAPTARPPQAR